MRKLILFFMVFLAGLWGLERIGFALVILGIGMIMAIMAALHILATPANYDY